MQTHIPCFEMAECTEAPVAMEESDHEAPSSSDEQDSGPDFPPPPLHHHHHQQHTGNHDFEQVLVMGTFKLNWHWG